MLHYRGIKNFCESRLKNKNRPTKRESVFLMYLLSCFSSYKAPEVLDHVQPSNFVKSAFPAVPTLIAATFVASVLAPM